MLSLAALFACKQEKVDPEPTVPTISGNYSINIDSPIEIAPEEELSVFYGETGTDVYGSNDIYTMPSIGSKATGTLSTPLKEETKYDWFVIYPYSSDYESPDDLPFELSSQTQNGPDDDAHLQHFLVGTKMKVSASGMGPKVSLQDMTATLAVKVYNTSNADFAISSIKIAADAPIGAAGSVDLTSGKPVFTAADQTKDVTLKVKNATLARNASATFYVSVVPCEATLLTITIGEVSVETEIEGLEAGSTESVDFSTSEIPHFIDGITSSIDANNNWHATLAAPYTLSGEFDLKDLFSKLPSGSITFELGSYSKQNALVQGKYNELEACLVDGHWNPNFPFGSAFNVNDADKCGILFVMKKDSKPLFNIYLSCVDPVAGKIYTVGDKYHISVPEIFADNYEGWGPSNSQFDAAEAEYWQTIKNWQTTMLNPGAQEVVHLAELFSDYSPVVDPGNPDEPDPSTYIRLVYYSDTMWKAMLKWLGNFADLSFKGTDGEEIFFYNGKDLELTDYGKSLTRNSKGLYWMPGWTAMYSSARWNIEESQRGPETHNTTQADGTYWGNMDGNQISGSESAKYYYDHEAERLRAERGIYIEDGILKTDENYTGIAFRMAPRLCFEYDYGTQIYIIGPRYIAHCYFNRYFAPATADDK